METFVIDDEFRDLLPELSEEEFHELTESVIREGIINPILVWNTSGRKVIVDGHHRYQIAMARQMPDIPVKEINFESREDVIEWILKHQLGRRNLTDFERNEVALRYKEIISNKMNRRMATSTGGVKPQPIQKSLESTETIELEHKDGTVSGEAKKIDLPKKTTTRAELAKIAGTSERSVSQSEFILKNGSEEQKQRARRGGKGNTLNAITREIKEIMTQVCSVCGHEKPLTDFFRRQTVCKECQRRLIEETAVQDSIDGLYDVDAEVTTSAEEIRDEFICNFNNYLDSLREILEDGKDTVMATQKANHMVVSAVHEAAKALSELGKEFTLKKK